MFTRWLKIESDKSALIIGPRRSGKTTYLKQRFPGYTYVTLDDLDAYEWARLDPKGFILHLGRRAIIDEIQRAPLLTVAVKYAIDNENALFFMTGSSSIGLLDASADTLAGRVNIYHFPTACWGENISGPGKPFTDAALPFNVLKEANRSLPDVLTHGLFPEVLIQETSNAKGDILRNYKNTYFTRDLMQLSNIENIEGILAIYHHLIRSIGSHLETANFARESGLSFPTAKKYLNALLQSELVFKLYGYQYGPAKRYIKAGKMYFADNGILSSFNTPVSEGQRLENFVISELEKRRKLGHIDADALYYYKSASGREIDVIYEKNGLLHAVEIKATKNPGTKELQNLTEFSKTVGRDCRLILFYLGDDYQYEKGVHILPVASLFTTKG